MIASTDETHRFQSRLPFLARKTAPVARAATEGGKGDGDQRGQVPFFSPRRGERFVVQFRLALLHVYYFFFSLSLSTCTLYRSA